MSACIYILCRVLEILLFFFVFRNIDLLDLEDNGTCTVIAAGYHHSVVICPLAHNGAALQRRISISPDGVPCLSTEFFIHQMVKIILSGVLFRRNVSPALKQGFGPDFGSAKYFSCNSGNTFVSYPVILHS